MSVRPRVFVSAYACSPYKGSEPGVGWGFVATLSKYCDLWVVVEEEKFRDDISNYLKEHPDFGESVRFFFIRKQRNRLLRRIWPPSYYWYYRRWHEAALVLAKSLHAEVQFDLAHQLTMVGYREPGYLWKLGIPFVWGPIGGMGLFPWRFLTKVGFYSFFYYLGYNFFNLLQMHLGQRPRLAARIAGVGLIAATPENQAGTKKFWGVESRLITEVGLPNAGNCTPIERKPGEPMRLVWTGLHIPRKALNIALEALAMLPKALNWKFEILGEGQCTKKWMRLAENLGLVERCHFCGWLPRDDAIEVMRSSHLMVITSLRDLTSTVTIEALALGLPIICLDHCGFSGVVDDSCGIKVPMASPTTVVEAFSLGIRRLASDETLRYKLAQGAVVRAQEFSWRKKGIALNEIYCQKLCEVGGGSTG